MKLRYIYYTLIILSFIMFDLVTTVYALNVFAGRVYEKNPEFFNPLTHFSYSVLIIGLCIMFFFVDRSIKEFKDNKWGKWCIRALGHVTGISLVYVFLPCLIAGYNNFQVILFLATQVSNGCGCG